MKRIENKSSRRYKYMAEDIYNVMADIENWSKWWPNTFQFKAVEATPEVVGSKLAVNSMGGKFEWEIDGVKPNEEICISYTTGPLVGAGRWTFEQTSDSTVVSYEVILEPQHWMLKLMTRFMDCNHLFNVYIQSVLDSLGKRLEKLEREYQQGV
ncbi:SRPBCC family protein [Planctomycetota bacterium]